MVDSRLRPSTASGSVKPSASKNFRSCWRAASSFHFRSALILASSSAIARMLEGIEIDAAGAGLELDAGPSAQDAGRSIVSLVRRRGGPAGAATIRFGLDPLGAMAAGAAPLQWNETATRLGGLVAELAGAGFKGPFAVADGRVIHNAGGSEVQELGFVLSVATSYLRALEGCGIGLDDADRNSVLTPETAGAGLALAQPNVKATLVGAKAAFGAKAMTKVYPAPTGISAGVLAVPVSAFVAGSVV